MSKIAVSHPDTFKSSLKFEKSAASITRDANVSKLHQNQSVKLVDSDDLPSSKEISGQVNAASGETSSYIFGAKLSPGKHSVTVGFSQLPKQIYRKTKNRSFSFNIIVVGAAGLGKSTFLNALFMSDIYNEAYPGASVRFNRDQSVPSVASATYNLVEKGVNLSMTVIDTPGYAEALDNSTCFQPLMDEIARRNLQRMDTELRVNRQLVGSGCEGSIRLRTPEDPLVHACFYFLPPTGHTVRKVDLQAMHALGDKVNLIPVIAKADTMTTSECAEFKKVVRTQLEQENILTYDFPPSALPEQTSSAGSTSSDVASLHLRQPFAVCTSTQEVTKPDGTKVRCRVYPWGMVETDSLEHNDFTALKTLIMQHFMQDLVDVTYTKHYTTYRADTLSEIMTNTDFSLVTGRDPLSQLDAEKKAHSAKLDTLVKEMNKVYLDKVKEREIRLKDTERDMLERIETMQAQLIAETEDLSAARKKFNAERLAWEMENREITESIAGSYEKLEKIKKRRGLF